MTSIAELPDNIICHIISLVSLTNKEAIRLSLLSKELFWALQKRPSLSFHGGCKKELEYVHSTLVRYHADGIPLDIFAFKMGYELKNLQTQCITLAAKKRLRHLDLRGFGSFSEHFCKMESLVKLRLQGFIFKPRTSIVWPNLRQLSLHYVEMGIEDFEKILMASPLILNLEIIYCFSRYVNYFKVHNLRNLKQLNVGLTGTQTFEVKDAPELESITCSHQSHNPGFYQNIQNIGQCQDVNAGVYRNIKTLSLNHVQGNGDLFRNFGHHFPRLENLSISNNKVLEVLVLSSSSLKNIRLENISKLDEARFDVPNVVLFEYSTDTGSYPSLNTVLIPKLSFSGNPGGWISRIKLSYTYKSMNTLWFLKLNEFLTALNMSEILINVKFCGLTSEHFHKNSQQGILGMKPKVHEFHIDTVWGLSLSFARAIVDNIFLICEPETVTYPPYYRDKFERLVYEKRISESVHEKKIRSPTWLGFKYFSCPFRFF